MLRDERGATMVVVLIAMVLVIVMGASFSLSANTETNLSSQNVNANQAFHTARNGVDLTAEYIIRNKTTDIDEEDLKDKLNNLFNSNNSSDPSSITDLSIKSTNGKIEVTSTANYRDVKRTATLELEPKTVFDYAVFTTSEGEDMTIHNKFSVEEIIGTNASKVDFKGNSEDNVDVEYEVGIYRENLTNIIDEIFPSSNSNNHYYHFEEFDDIKDEDFVEHDGRGQGVLEFEINSNEDLYIRLEGELDNVGNIVTSGSGDGVLHLLVNHDLKLTKPNDTVQSKIIIYSKEEIDIKIPGASEVDAYIFAPNAKFNSTGGSTEITAGMIIKEFDSPNTSMEYDDFYKEYFSEFFDDEEFAATYTRGLWK
ncbi:hypothetical protein [Natranaerobius trueperi]|uniref:Type 4 fimbrial biogenesis protein PilX N-terminal domain-containing protein n=1 Tax=Natranaerobius trueperi TaxID=759412 RepID=A0A226C213_9FIRM|nr:hypothetical protein [Natranaerobius trueperi]OWZ84634.1 hypothetical protein CDO51_02415 [Natranaerobius trueperi]